MRTDDWYKEAQQEADLGPQKTERNYSNGMNAVDDDREVENAMRSIKGLFIDKLGKAMHPGGTTSVFTSKDISDFARYHREPDAEIATVVDTLICAEVDYATGVAGHLWGYNEGTGAFTDLHSGYDAAEDGQVCLLQVDERMYTTSKLNLLNYDGTGTFSNVGVDAPISTQVLVPSAIGAAGSGNPDSVTTGISYAYVYTVTDAHGETSNPSPFSIDVIANKQNIELNFDGAAGYLFSAGIISAVVSGTGLGEVDVYRTGGTSSDLTWVKTFVPKTTAGSVVQDTATSARPVDTLLNRDIGTIVPVYSRNKPPRGLRKIFQHSGRIMGFGQSVIQAVAEELVSPAALWMSRPNEPWAWGSDDNGVDDDGGYLLIDANDADWMLDAVSTGSLAIIGRQSSVYALYGDGFSTFRAVQISNSGVASRRSMVRERNIVRYLGADGIFYEVANDEPKQLSTPIQTVFDAFTDTELATAVVWQFRKRLFVSIRKDDASLVCYCFDLTVGAWCDMSNQTGYLVRQARGLTPIGGGRPVLYAAGRNANPGLRKLMTSAATDIPFYVETPMVFMSTGDDDCKMLEFYLEGSYAAGATAGTVTITTRTIGGDIAYTLPMATANRRLCRMTRPPTNIMGYAISVIVQGSMTAGYIGTIMWRWRRVRTVQ